MGRAAGLRGTNSSPIQNVFIPCLWLPIEQAGQIADHPSSLSKDIVMQASPVSRRDFIKLAGASGMVAGLPATAFAGRPAFTDGFLWGVASSASQVESREGRGRSNWDAFSDQKGRILDGSTNAVNTAFESHYPGDFAMLATAGVNAFRFSFAWPRIQPDGPGKPS